MITVPDDWAERRHDFAWAALASCAVNLLLWVLAVWLSGVHLTLVPPHDADREYVVSSSTARIERRQPVPVPRTPIRKAQRPTPPVPKPQPHVEPKHVSQPREIAREVPNAPPQTRRAQQTTLAQTLAQQEQQFARVAARLHAENSPLSAATISPEAAAAMRKQYYNLSGSQDREGVQAVLTPIKHWFDGDASCYYVRYDAEFSGGGSEDGTIPWPVCYPRTADRMLPLDRTHALPIPYPPPGFTLPAHAYVTPLLRGIYDKRPNPSGT